MERRIFYDSTKVRHHAPELETDDFKIKTVRDTCGDCCEDCSNCPYRDISDTINEELNQFDFVINHLNDN